MIALTNSSSKGRFLRYKANGVPKSVWVEGYQTVIVQDLNSVDDLLNASSRQKNEIIEKNKNNISTGKFESGKGFVKNVTDVPKWKGQIGLIQNSLTHEFSSSTFQRVGADPLTLYYRKEDTTPSTFAELGTTFYSHPHRGLPYTESDAIDYGPYRLDLNGGNVITRTPQAFTNILPENMGIVINSNDPSSSGLAATYRATWGIPLSNVVTVSLGSNVDMGGNAGAITTARNTIATNMPTNVQWLALCWKSPSRAGANSITWAMTMGYSTISQNTDPLPTNPMWGYGGNTPFDTLGIRPSMLVYSAYTVQQAILAHGFRPSGTCYMVASNDQTGQPRGRARLAQMWNLSASTAYIASGISFNFTNSLSGPQGDTATNNVLNKADLMFYFNGMYTINGMNTNTIRKGAIGDYVTSTSGNLPDGLGQRPVTYLLDHGFVGTAGSVIEPWQNAFNGGYPPYYNAGAGDLTDQFPNIEVLLNQYISGKSLIEAYWKSLKQPTRMLLLGDPMVAPFAYGVGTGSTPTINGCTNPYADNFNPSATTNDGSCSFSENTYDMSHSSTTISQLVPLEGSPIIYQPTSWKQARITGGYMKVSTWSGASLPNIYYPCNVMGLWTVRYTNVSFSANSYQWINSALRIQPRSGGDTDSEIVYVFPNQSTQVVEDGYVNLNTEYAKRSFVLPQPITLTSIVGKNGLSDNNACSMQFSDVRLFKRIIRL